MNLYNGRNKIIKLFESKDITLYMHAYDTKSDGGKESEQKFEKGIEERVKLIRQKTDDEDVEDDEEIDTADIPDLQSQNLMNKEEIKEDKD